MAFKMNRPSMIEVSYNKEKNSVSPLHKETDPELTAEVIGGAVGGAISGSSSESNESGGMRNKLKQIGGKKAKSLGKEAKPLKPLVKSVNILKSDGVKRVGGEVNISTSGTLKTRGNKSYSSSTTKTRGNRGYDFLPGDDKNTITTNINASSKADGSKNINKTKNKITAHPEGWGEKNKKTKLTANVDNKGNKSFNKNVQKTKSVGVGMGEFVIGKKNKNVTTSATSNVDGSQSFNKIKTKDGTAGIYGGVDSINNSGGGGGAKISNKEKSLSVNVGADGSKKIIKTKKKRGGLLGLFGITKNKTVTYTKN